MLSVWSFSLFCIGRRIFFFQVSSLTRNCSYFIFIANISSALKVSVVSLPRMKTDSNALMQGILLPLGSRRYMSGVISPARVSDFTGLCCTHSEPLLEGWPGILRTFWDFVTCGWPYQSEKLISFMYACWSLGSSDILTSPSYAFLSPCCLCPVECGIRVRLFIYPVWICKSL